MVAMKHGLLPREGFYIDPLVKFIRVTLLRPLILALVLIFLYYFQYSTSTTFTLSTSAHSYLVITTAFLLAVGTLLDVNDYLTDKFHNNWTEDSSWAWNDEIVLITGGSSGIGASVARELILRNLKTTIVVVDYVLPTFTPKKGSRFYFFPCDLSQASEIKSVCAKIRKEVGDPTVVFNNAGLTRGKTVIDGSYADVEITFRTNIVAPFLLLKEFLPAMARKNHGHIVATSSMSSVITPAGLADYAATKLGMAALHESVALELKHRHKAPRIRNSLAILGFIETPMFKGRTNQSQFVAPLMNVDTVADAIVDVLYSGKGKNIYLPGVMRYLSCVRGWPGWIRSIFAESTEQLQVDYVGRQKIDPVGGGLVA